MGLEGKTYNKGEWAELYVLLKLLGEGKLYAADSYLRKKPNSYLEVLKILREEIAGMVIEYATVGDRVEIIAAGELIVSIPAAEFLENARRFFEYLLVVHGAAVPAPAETVRFSNVIKVTKPKSPSVRGLGGFGGKADIAIQLRDAHTAVVSTMGFSIKSQFAQPPTLYNAGTGSQLLFHMEGMSDEVMDAFNSAIDNKGKRKWSECVQIIEKHGVNPVFIGCKTEELATNFLYIRETMAEVFAWMLRERLLVDTSCKGVVELCARMEKRNPLGYKVSGLYEKVVKDFLFASFSGMTGSRLWNGEEQVNGGYIVVLPTGDVLCYHASDREQFRDYLFRNTFIEYVSCRKYRWGFVEKDALGRCVLPLNGAVRFYKNTVFNCNESAVVYASIDA